MQLKHIAIIPDGNRRWSKRHNLSHSEGHRIAAEKTLPDLVEKAIEMRIGFFSFWAMSTDNFKKRSTVEITSLMKILSFFLDTKINDFNKKGIKFKTMGDISTLPGSIRLKIEKTEKLTQKNNKITFIMAINYSGRDEIIRTVNKVIAEKIGDKINQINFSQFLDSSQFPDPDMIIRTGGESRLSGFMLWQSEYSELFFTNTLFPDFSPKNLYDMVQDYYHRKRRFGK